MPRRRARPVDRGARHGASAASALADKRPWLYAESSLMPLSYAVRHLSPKGKLKARVPDVKAFIKTAQRDGKDYSSLNRDRIE